MKDYEVIYIDSHGDKQNYLVTSTDVRTAMNNTFELVPQCKRIVRCARRRGVEFAPWCHG